MRERERHTQTTITSQPKTRLIHFVCYDHSLSYSLWNQTGAWLLLLLSTISDEQKEGHLRLELCVYVCLGKTYLFGPIRASKRDSKKIR